MTPPPAAPAAPSLPRRPDIAAEGWPWVISPLVGAALLARWQPRLSLAPLALAAAAALFFRDPHRVTPAAPALYAPADGRVILVDQVHDDRFIHGPAHRVAIFLSILDVHINRSPTAGVVRYRAHVAGDFRAAWRTDAAAVNERHYLGLDTPRGPILIVQVAGLVARRIICRPALGQSLAPGERIGLIKFGSRTDLLFPTAIARPAVSPGDHVRGGLTPIGDWL